MDAAGDLFGTTKGGGPDLGGTVFEISAIGSDYASTATTLAPFNSLNSANGSNPSSGVIADAAGDLFGVTANGGAYGYGTVFEIAKTSTGYATAPTLLASFNNADGASPSGSLIADAAGNLFGTTSEGGGPGNYGIVFEIAKTASGYASTPITVASFNGTDGLQPSGGLIMDAAGDLFGTTYGGGANSDGTIFEIAKSGTGYASTPIALASFNGTNGAHPTAGLIMDAAGDLFGTTYYGGVYGGANGDGTVFELINNGGGSYTLTRLVSFNGTDGSGPEAALIIDAAGNLFGTTEGGGANGDGTVLEVVKIAGLYANAPTTLVNFNSTNGAGPAAGLIADAFGDLFGTTQAGGLGYGTVFGLTGTGFQVVPPTPTPVILPPSEIATTASGLVYSRVTRTFNGAVTITNISGVAISGPFQIRLTGLTSGVTLANATGEFSGAPYLTVPGTVSLASGQSATVDLQLDDPSLGTINFTPVIYSGSI
jgi:uncharacterized repeat protein (TIGR03803 family)